MSDERRFMSRIVIKSGANIRVLPIEALDFAEAQGDGVTLKAGAERFRLVRTLASFAAVLDGRFLRVHRSYLINLDRLKRIETYSRNSRAAILSDGSRVLVSRGRYPRLRDFLENKT